MTVAKAIRKAAMGKSFLTVPVGGIMVVVFVGLGGRFVGSEGVGRAPGTFCVGFMLLHFLVSLAAKRKHTYFILLPKTPYKNQN